MHTSFLSANWLDKDAESLVWLASYPRSGNTFTRVLLANYFMAGEQDFDINALYDFIPPDTSASLWEDFAGQEAGNDFARIWPLRKQFIQHYRRRQKPSGFAGLKTHNANLTVDEVSGFDFRNSDRALYIVRHPLDVLLSYSDYNGRDLNAAAQILCLSGACVTHGTAGGIELRGSWAEHVSSWIETPPCPVLLVRYEELVQATAETLTAILTFLGAPVVEEKVSRAVEASRFEKLREQEVTRDFQERPPTTRSGKFFREGRSLQWLREVPFALAAPLADQCEAVMDRVGYTHPRSVLYDGSNAYKSMRL